MARKRPAALTVMGILNIVFGSFGLICGICSGFGLLVDVSKLAQGGQFQNGQNPFAETAAMQAFLRDQVPGYAAFQVVQVGQTLVLGLLLIIGGIGLLQIQSWGRVLSIVYSVIDIVATLASLLYTLALVNPATERFFQGKPQPLGNATVLNLISIFGAIIGVAYAVVLLIMMLLPSVAAAFARKHPADEYDLDRREEEDDLQRERRPRQEWEQEP
jgi:hypothetical protein